MENGLSSHSQNRLHTGTGYTNYFTVCGYPSAPEGNHSPWFTQLDQKGKHAVSRATLPWFVDFTTSQLHDCRQVTEPFSVLVFSSEYVAAYDSISMVLVWVFSGADIETRIWVRIIALWVSENECRGIGKRDRKEMAGKKVCHSVLLEDP